MATGLVDCCSKRKPDGRRCASAHEAKAKNCPEAVRAGARPAKTTT
ncbi:hypothetical protein C7S16_6306 [Burkholderia thailandensis]|uniref:Uncharacterized protein n=1 Tax=Burkholderia thailandensis TaxID=57975 RepID=A0AAW9CNW6_BURTH|nr:hypothetical protein [Burkholderia thailandensis]MDW9252345.1 hypothetical protein [Burkholderia thailandensis]